jgi:prepilin-type N-terminal cleavage/methylation domain-containing protein
MKHKKGFTLMELIIVIVILGILAAISFISYIGAQARMRDSKRKTDMQTIAGALTLYHAESKTWSLIGTNPTCGYTVQGVGFFYIKNSLAIFQSMNNYLRTKGYLTGDARDPLCPQSQDSTVDANRICGTNHPDYILFTSATIATVYANLENSTLEEEAAAKLGFSYLNDASCSSPGNVSYPCGNTMNYGVTVP